jgi:hypothetical protein
VKPARFATAVLLVGALGVVRPCHADPMDDLLSMGDLDVFETYVNALEDVDARGEHDNTPLTALAQSVSNVRANHGDDAADRAAALFADLLARGASPEARDADGRTALLLAANDADDASPGLIRLLLDAGADVDARDRAGSTALMLAADRAGADVVRELLSREAQAGLEDERGFTALDYVLLPRSGVASLDAIDALVKAGADVNHRDKNGWTPLMHASRWGPVEAIPLLLVSGANSGTVSHDGWSAFTVALASAELGRWIEWLKADPRMPEGPDESLQMYAEMFRQWSTGAGHTQRIEALLRFGQIDLEAEQRRRDFEKLRSDWDQPLGQSVRELLDNPPPPEDPATPEEVEGATR